MLGELPAAGGKTVGADKNYDTAAFVASARKLGVTPHVAQNITAHRGSNIDGRTTRHDGYRVSQVIRKRIEEANGWIKEVRGMAQTKFRGVERVCWMFTFQGHGLQPDSYAGITRDAMSPPRYYPKAG